MFQNIAKFGSEFQYNSLGKKELNITSKVENHRVIPLFSFIPWILRPTKTLADGPQLSCTKLFIPASFMTVLETAQMFGLTLGIHTVE